MLNLLRSMAQSTALNDFATATSISMADRRLQQRARFRRDEIGERAIDQVYRISSKGLGNAVADVRQCALARCLPEPSFLAALEFFDEPLGSRGLRTRLFLGRSTTRSQQPLMLPTQASNGASSNGADLV